MGSVQAGNQRLSQFAGQTTLEVEICTCGVLFAAPKNLLDKRRFDGQSFYCPNGHCLSFVDAGETRLRRQLEETRQSLQGTRDLLRHEERSHAALEDFLSEFGDLFPAALGCRRCHWRLRAGSCVQTTTRHNPWTTRPQGVCYRLAKRLWFHDFGAYRGMDHLYRLGGSGRRNRDAHDG
jgi:hypothetical protein